MRAHFISENNNFERSEDPKENLKIGKNRFKQPGDQELGYFLIRNNPDGSPSKIFINTLNGNEISIGLYAWKDVYNALSALMIDNK